MKQNKKIAHVTWDRRRNLNDKASSAASSLPIRDRLLKSIAERIPFNSPHSTTATSLDWYGNYYVVYHDLYPIAVGKKGMYPFMFRPPWRGENWGDKESRKIKFLDETKRYFYYDTSSATRLGDLRIWMGFRKTCIGRARNEKTNRMKKIYESCPLITPHHEELSDRDEYVTGDCAFDAIIHDKLIEHGVMLIEGYSDVWDAFHEGRIKDVVEREYDYSSKREDVPLLETPCTWYYTTDGKPVPMEEIPEILFKALSGNGRWNELPNGTATTPFNCLSRRDTMKTSQPKPVIDEVTRRFNNLFAIYHLKKFIGCFSNPTTNKDVSTKSYHPQAVRDDGSLAVVDILDCYYNLNANVTCPAAIRVSEHDKPMLEFYSNFQRLAPILEYLCSDDGLRKQDGQGLSELEVYDFRYRFETDKDIVKVPVDFSLTLKLNQTSMKFKFSTDFSEVFLVNDNGETLETITHGRFADWILEHFTAVRKATTFDFDEI